MKIIVNDKELKEYFNGLSRLLMQVRNTQSEDTEFSDSSTLATEEEQSIQKAVNAVETLRGIDAFSLNKLKLHFEKYIGKSVEMLTPAGTVEGLIVKVGGDFLIVQEQGGMKVMLPLEQVIVFQLKGKQVE